MNTQLGLTLKPGLKADNKYVEHVPMGLSFFIFPTFIFLKLAKVPVKVTGSRRLENGLVVSGSFLTRTTSRVMIRATKFEEKIVRLKSLCVHMDIKKRKREKGEEVPFLLSTISSPFSFPTPLLFDAMPFTEVGRGLHEREQHLLTPCQFLKVFFSSK